MIGGSIFGIDKGKCYISFQSKYELDIPDNKNEVIVVAGNKYLYNFLFIWYHPDITIRLVFKVGVILGFLSVLIGLISIFK